MKKGVITPSDTLTTSYGFDLKDPGGHENA